MATAELERPTVTALADDDDEEDDDEDDDDDALEGGKEALDGGGDVAPDSGTPDSDVEGPGSTPL